MLHEMFKDIKGAIRNRKSKERQYTGHQKKTIHWPSEKDNTLAIRKRQYTGHQKKTKNTRVLRIGKQFLFH
jgi:hypothetical protein